jgi:L-lactate dehydrogenase complex protein LldG
VNARDEILGRLRAALSDQPEPVHIPRRYATSRAADLPALFTDRLVDYRAHVHQDLASALSGVDRLLVPADIPRTWLDGFPGTVVVDEGLDVAALDRMDAVLTGCAVAIAETGTIVLDAGPDQGRRVLSLLPDLHVCVVPTDRIVGTVPEALERLDARRPQTWISGPSATSDIELERVEGVHGPRRLVVVIVEP